tara:strand:- start:63 stop:257 length:195 start_codon:yes stop_codon:yes gene_type:complete
MKTNTNSEELSAKKVLPPPSFIKLAMRNMVRKGNQSLQHFALTAFGLLGFLLLLAYFSRPTLPN